MFDAGAVVSDVLLLPARWLAPVTTQSVHGGSSSARTAGADAKVFSDEAKAMICLAAKK